VNPIAYTDSWQAPTTYPNYYQTDILTSESDYIPLEAEKQYYMEVYHINEGGDGSFSLSVEIPNTDTTIEKWQTYEVQTFTTSIQEEPEIVEFVSKGASSGSFTLKVLEYNAVDFSVTNNYTATIAWNASASAFCSKINVFPWYRDFGTTCTLTTYDATGAVTANPALAVEFRWRASISKFRSGNSKRNSFTSIKYDAAGLLTITPIQ
jgi:hypothetical protein